MKKIIAICFTIGVILLACRKSSIQETQPELSGYVSLTDESGKFFSDNSGMKISIENSNPLISAISDSHGHFVLPLTPELTSFTLVYNKTGFGTFKRYFTRDNSGNLNFWEFDNSKYPTTQSAEGISEKSSVVVNTLSVSIVGDTLRISCNISSSGDGQKYVQLLTQKDLPNISISTIDQSKNPWSFKIPVKNGDNVINECLKCSEICNKWMSGEVVYFTAYGDSYYTNTYLDRSANQIILPNLNLNSHVQPVSVVIP